MQVNPEATPETPPGVRPLNVQPFQPHKKLAWSLLAIYLVWMGILWVMYFTTVE